jgi:hypothetical protein
MNTERVKPLKQALKQEPSQRSKTRAKAQQVGDAAIANTARSSAMRVPHSAKG